MVAGRDTARAAAGEAEATPRPRRDHTGWSDSSARSVLQLMAESVAEMVGFDVACLSVALDDELVTVAYAGPEEHRDYVFEHSDPVSVLDPLLEQGERWGRFRFLAAEDHVDELDGHWVVLEPRVPDDVHPADCPDCWHPLDVLVAFLADDDGNLVGALSLDRPQSGRRPDAVVRSLLERYAAQTERAVLTAFEREGLVHQVAHAEAARRLVRAASMPAHASLEAVLRTTHRPLVEGFGAAGSWVQVIGCEETGQGRGVGYARTLDGEAVVVPTSVVDLACSMAPVLWEEQQVLVLSHDAVSDDTHPGLAGRAGVLEVLEVARDQLVSFGLGSALAVPLGVGQECLGFLVLAREVDDAPWSSVEISSAMEIGYDLGAALMTVRALERERALVSQLKKLDDYRSQLIATLSHELRTPLAVISGNLELLGDLDLDDLASRHRLAMTRGTTRMKKVVDDLLLLAQVSDPSHPRVRVPVDLQTMTRDVVSLLDDTARAKGVVLQVDVAADDPADLVVPGDPAELDRLLGNLTSNAMKFTPSGGTVTVSAARRERDVVLRVADDGLGISEEDQLGLFRAFFRTTNPDALREPGTGLGLSIVATIVERHEGTVSVDSRLGEGTTITVSLPRTVVAS